MSFTIKKGDRSPSLTATFESPPGTPIDLTGASVKFIMASSPGAAPKVNTAATVVDATAGSVRYDWGATDTDTVGLYYAEWEITYGNGNKQTVPSEDYLHIVVKLDLG